MNTKLGPKRPNLKGLIRANVLRRAEQAASTCNEILWAAREYVRANREFIAYYEQTIAESRATLERIDRLLASRRATPERAASQCEVAAEPRGGDEVVANNKPLPETQTVLPSTTSSATTRSGADG